jgi:7,8-dihydroneopterin aldolase/epimerase/oxygenase
MITSANGQSAARAGHDLVGHANRRHVLRLGRLHATARLGHEAAERAQPQEVVMSVTVEFASPPAACHSDRLEDTLCGAELCAALARVCQSGEYALIEHLAERLHAAARALAPPGARVEIELTKVAPPIVGLAGGMTFVISGSGGA